jgi:hypothetical protein
VPHAASCGTHGNAVLRCVPQLLFHSNQVAREKLIDSYGSNGAERAEPSGGTDTQGWRFDKDCLKI